MWIGNTSPTGPNGHCLSAVLPLPSPRLCRTLRLPRYTRAAARGHVHIVKMLSSSHDRLPDSKHVHRMFLINHLTLAAAAAGE